MIEHVVRPGEHIGAIARSHGFGDWKTVWEDAGNAALRVRRDDPNVLAPGDVLSIPEARHGTASVATGARHRFRVGCPALCLYLVLERAFQGPLAHVACTLDVDGGSFALRSAGDGRIGRGVGVATVVAECAVPPERNLPPVPLRLALQVGGLDPVDTDGGQRQRLDNLGYGAGSEPGAGDARNAWLLRAAVEEFQCDHGLAVDGICGPRTQARLREQHGC